jgi:hypothetical protein
VEIEQRISDLFEKRVALKIMDMLTEEQKDKASSVEGDKFFEFLEQEGFDFGSVMISEAADFGGEMVEYFTYIKGLIDGKASK